MQSQPGRGSCFAFTICSPAVVRPSEIETKIETQTREQSVTSLPMALPAIESDVAVPSMMLASEAALSLARVKLTPVSESVPQPKGGLRVLLAEDDIVSQVHWSLIFRPF